MSDMIERVAKAIDAVQIWSRFNDWTSDRVEGFPVEICRYRHDATTTDGIEVLERFPATKSQDEAVREIVSEMRSRAAIEAMREPTPHMQEAGAAELERQRIALEWDSPSIWIGKFFSAMIDSALSQSPHSLPSEDR